MAERFDGSRNEPRIISRLETESLYLFRQWVRSIMRLPNAQMRPSQIIEVFLRQMELSGISDTNFSRLEKSADGPLDILDRPVVLRKDNRTSLNKLDRLIRSKAVVEMADKVEYRIYVYDPMSRILEVQDTGEKVRLRRTEGAVFSLLIKFPEKVINFRTFRDFVWPDNELDGLLPNVRVNIDSLRHKIHDDNRERADWHIINIPTEGYMLRVGLGSEAK